MASAEKRRWALSQAVKTIELLLEWPAFDAEEKTNMRRAIVVLREIAAEHERVE